MTSFLLLVQVAKIDEDNATASGRGEESRADAPVSPSEQGTEVSLLRQGVTAHWKMLLHIARSSCTWKCNTCLSTASIHDSNTASCLACDIPEAIVDRHLHASDMSALLEVLHLIVHALTLLLTRTSMQS